MVEADEKCTIKMVSYTTVTHKTVITGYDEYTSKLSYYLQSFYLGQQVPEQELGPVQLGVPAAWCWLPSEG